MQTGIYQSGRIPEEIELIPDGYEKPCDHPGTLEKLTYKTWESFSYEEHSQELTKEAWVYLPYDYDENKDLYHYFDFYYLKFYI